VRYHWPGRTCVQSLDTFDPGSIQIRLGARDPTTRFRLLGP
jgi:hypothetical protein